MKGPSDEVPAKGAVDPESTNKSTPVASSEYSDLIHDIKSFSADQKGNRYRHGHDGTVLDDNGEVIEKQRMPMPASKHQDRQMSVQFTKPVLTKMPMPASKAGKRSEKGLPRMRMQSSKATLKKMPMDSSKASAMSMPRMPMDSSKAFAEPMPRMPMDSSKALQDLEEEEPKFRMPMKSSKPWMGAQKNGKNDCGIQ